MNSEETSTNGKAGTAVVSVSAGRFPWVKEFEDRYGVDKIEWRALIDAVFPSAKTLDSVILALSYCKARNLDVFKRPVHIVPMYDKTRGGTVDTIWPGIGELRTTAVRTGEFGGQDAAEYGPIVTNKYGSVEVEHPEWCAITVYRMVQGQRVACHGPRVYWRETYASKKHDDPAPNSMWQKRPFGQIEKCACAGALRAAFPEEIGNEYAAEEMEGKVIDGQFQVIAAPPTPAAMAKPSLNRLDAFGGKEAQPEPETAHEPDDAANRAALAAVLERLSLVQTKTDFKQARKDALPVMGRFDEEWPAGKEEIIAALAQAEQRAEASNAPGA